MQKHCPLTLLFLLLLLSGCTKEPIQSIDPAFADYVDQFFAEGRARGFDRELEDVNLIVKFGPIDDPSTQGQCRYRRDEVTIDPEHWDNLSEERRTWLIFHELGHCVLDREHRNDHNEQGACRSLMRGREDGYDCAQNLHSGYWWDYYLDELFDPTTPFPGWTDQHADYHATAPTTTLFTLDTLAEELYLDVPTLATGNLSVELTFRNWGTPENGVFMKLGNIGFNNCNVCTGVNYRISRNNQTLFQNFERNLLMFGDDITLSIRRLDDLLCFYVNETFVHTCEASLLEGTIIQTNRFDQLLELSLRVEGME